MRATSRRRTMLVSVDCLARAAPLTIALLGALAVDRRFFIIAPPIVAPPPVVAPPPAVAPPPVPAPPVKPPGIALALMARLAVVPSAADRAVAAALAAAAAPLPPMVGVEVLVAAGILAMP